MIRHRVYWFWLQNEFVKLIKLHGMLSIQAGSSTVDFTLNKNLLTWLESINILGTLLWHKGRDDSLYGSNFAPRCRPYHREIPCVYLVISTAHCPRLQGWLEHPPIAVILEGGMDLNMVIWLILHAFSKTFNSLHWTVGSLNMVRLFIHMLEILALTSFSPGFEMLILLPNKWDTSCRLLFWPIRHIMYLCSQVFPINFKDLLGHNMVSHNRPRRSVLQNVGRIHWRGKDASMTSMFPFVALQMKLHWLTYITSWWKAPCTTSVLPRLPGQMILPLMLHWSGCTTKTWRFFPLLVYNIFLENGGILPNSPRWNMLKPR